MREKPPTKYHRGVIDRLRHFIAAQFSVTSMRQQDGSQPFFTPRLYAAAPIWPARFASLVPPEKQKSRTFGPAFVYENKVLNLCVSGAAPQTYAEFHTHGTLHFTPSTSKAYPIPHFPASHQNR